MFWFDFSLLENTGLVSIVMLMILISTRTDETSKLSKLTECVKNIKDWMTNNFLLERERNFHKLFINFHNYKCFVFLPCEMAKP